jgi:hypothetical protein
MARAKLPSYRLHKASGQAFVRLNGRQIMEADRVCADEPIASDYWSAYEGFVPAEKHLQTKRETHDGGIQLPHSALFGKISSKDALLFKKR